jgi:hypothetical protein
MGLGIVARDQEGDVVAALCSGRPYVTDPAMAEWKVAELSCKLGFKQVIVEGDALEVVMALRREGSCGGRYIWSSPGGECKIPS